MKPKDFKCPFKWEDRRPLIHDRVIFVPKYYDRHDEWTLPAFESPELFGSHAPIFIEFCSGNGAWIAQKALDHPYYHFIAVEMCFERARKIRSKIHNFNLNNLMIVCGEALTFARHYLKNDSIDAVFVNFPDPWPKNRHAKHRLFQKPFVDELSRIVKRGGETTFVTDDPAYSEQMVKVMFDNSSWRSSFADPFYITDWPGYGTSYFDALWREKGRLIRYLHFINQKEESL